VRRATFTDISEKMPAADRNSPSATTNAIAPAETICGTSMRHARASSVRTLSMRRPGSSVAAAARIRGATLDGSPATLTPITSGCVVAADAGVKT
jgi:hypothetical protein